MNVGPYHEQIRAARDLGLRLSEAEEQALLQLLREYGEDLERAVAKGLADHGAAWTRRLIHELVTRMSEDLTRATANGVRITARRVAELHAEATLALLASDAAGAALGAGVATTLRGLGTSAAQAVLARPALSAAMRSIRSGASAEADRILRTGILRGSEAGEIARALRLQIVGAEAFPKKALRDLRTIGYGTVQAMGMEPTPAALTQVREQAGAIARRARLVARTEIMTAEHETSIQAAIESPVVAALHWFLSNRHPEPDECDVFADEDLFGLGPGNFDPRQAPARPHPRCLCGFTHILRPVAEWGKPRGALPALQHDLLAVADRYGFSPSRAQSLFRARGVAPDADAFEQWAGGRGKRGRFSAQPPTVRKNVRALRNYARSKGWVRNPTGGPEAWGVPDDEGSFSWRMKIKLQKSMREGLEEGSRQLRVSTRLRKGVYVNPFTGEIVPRVVGEHIPLDQEWF